MDREFSKDEMRTAQGIAIILMITHHTFSNHLGMSAKICVAMFALLSGFGLSKKIRKKIANRKGNYLNISYKYIVKKIFTFLSIYWVCVGIFVIPLIIYKDLSIRQWIMLFLTLDKQVNGGLWYVTQYIWMLLLFPCLWGIINFEILSRNNLDMQSKGKNIGLLVLLLSGFLFLFITVYIIMKKCSLIYLLIFGEGIFFEKYKMLERVQITSKLAFKVTIVIAGILLGVTRYILTKNASDCWMDIFLVGGAIYFWTKIFGRLDCLQKMGELSAWMWFLHTWIYSIWGGCLPNINTFIKFVLVVLVCYGVSIVLDHYWKLGLSSFACLKSRLLYVKKCKN